MSTLAASSPSTMEICPKDCISEEKRGYNFVSKLIKKAGNLTSQIQESTGLTIPKPLEARLTRIRDWSTPYLTKYVEILDSKIDQTLTRSTGIATNAWKRVSEAEEKLLPEFIKTWVTSHVMRKGKSVLSLAEFTTALHDTRHLRASLSKASQRIREFYEIAAESWKKFVTKNSSNIKAAVLEITSSCLCLFNEIKNDAELVRTLVEQGEHLLEDTENTITAETLLNKVKESLSTERYDTNSAAYNDLVTKYFNIIVRFRQLSTATENVVRPTNFRLSRLVASTGEAVFTRLEDAVSNLYNRVVPQPPHPTTPTTASPTSTALATTNTKEEQQNGHQLTHFVRTKHMLEKLNEVRVVLQHAVMNSNPRELLQNYAKRSKFVNEFTNLYKFVTLAACRLGDMAVIPLYRSGLEFRKKPQVVAFELFIGNRREAVEKVLAASKGWAKNVKDEVSIRVKHQIVKVQLNLDKLKNVSVEVKGDVERLLTELMNIVREKEDRHKLPSKVYAKALEVYQTRKARWSTSGSNGTH